MVTASKRLSIVENPVKGFFDPVTLASELTIVLKHSKKNTPRTASEEKLSLAKAKSSRVANVRQNVIADFQSTHPHITKTHLTRRQSANHPVCLHPCLLRAIVRKLYPDGGVHVDCEDVDWITTRAPRLPSAPEGPSTSRGAEDREDCDASDSPQSSGLPESPEDPISEQYPSEAHGGDDTALASSFTDEWNQGGLNIVQLGSTRDPVPNHDPNHGRNQNDGLVVPDDVDHDGNHDIDRASDRKWWTEVGEVCPSVFDVPPPWSAGAQDRLLMCDLPNDVILTVDPVTGLVRATDISTYFGKRINYWLRLGINSNDNEGTRGMAFALAADLNTNTESLVYCVLDRTSSSTWVHIEMVVNLASWCSPAFSIHVSKLVVRYHGGQITTEESTRAADRLNATMRPASPQNQDRSIVPRVPANSSSHRLARTVARNQSARGPSDVRDVPIPKHLLTQTGVYIGAWGVVNDGTISPWWHLKFGKASEQPVTSRIRSHYNEKPYNFVLLFIAGCEGGLCHVVENAMKHMAAKILRLENVANSDEEFKVPIESLTQTVNALAEEIKRRHRDIICLAEDEPADVALEKERLASKERVDIKRYALDKIMLIGDEQARTRAISAVLNH